MCAGRYTCEGVHAPVCPCIWSPEVDINLLVLYLQRQGPHLKSEFNNGASLARQLALVSPGPSSQTGIICEPPCPYHIYKAAGNLNTGPYYCTASILHTPPPPQPLSSFLHFLLRFSLSLGMTSYSYADLEFTL